MGLDQWAGKRRRTPIAAALAETLKELESLGAQPFKVYHDLLEDEEQAFEKRELATWRKHSSLEGWMEGLWKNKHRMTAVFNCQTLKLDLDDINNLEETVTKESLPQTSGFFFGNPSDEYYREKDLQFCKDARQAIEEGWEVYYGSWW